MFAATWCCTRITAGQAAAGCRIRWWTGMSTPAASSSGSPATATGRVGRVRTGTWYLSVWCIRRKAHGPRRRTRRWRIRQWCARNRFCRRMLRASSACGFRSCTASDSVGITWRGGETPGETIPITRFYIARPDVDTAETINAQLAQGKNLILTPGIYELAAPIRVKRPHAVVLGLGFATLRPMKGTAAMTTTDDDGIEIAGLLFDAGPSESPVLLEVGPEGSRARHANDPITLHDVFFRVGGAGVGRAKVNLRINSNDTLVDHTWIWRADHGAGVGWELNISENGLVVNGNQVTIYGLFVEHHQQFQVLWKGNGGRTYFYQSEIPYDPPNQASYTSSPGVDG